MSLGLVSFTVIYFILEYIQNFEITDLLGFLGCIYCYIISFRDVFGRNSFKITVSA
jgi:hypothetical protein